MNQTFISRDTVTCYEGGLIMAQRNVQMSAHFTRGVLVLAVLPEVMWRSGFLENTAELPLQQPDKPSQANVLCARCARAQNWNN